MLIFAPFFAVAQQDFFCTYVESEDRVAFFVSNSACQRCASLRLHVVAKSLSDDNLQCSKARNQSLMVELVHGLSGWQWYTDHLSRAFSSIG